MSTRTQNTNQVHLADDSITKEDVKMSEEEEGQWKKVENDKLQAQHPKAAKSPVTTTSASPSTPSSKKTKKRARTDEASTPLTSSEKEPSKEVKTDESTPSADTGNHRGRYAHLMELTKNHKGEQYWTFYEMQTRKLSNRDIKAYESNPGVHVFEADDGRAHRMLERARLGVDGWKRIEGNVLKKHNFILIYDFNSTKDVDDVGSDEEECSDEDDN